MAVAITELAKALVTELTTVTGKTYERRYAPYYLAEDLETPKYVIITTRERPSLQSRVTDMSQLTVLVGLQQAVPEIESKNDEYIENTQWLDEKLQEVETNIKAPFRPGGPLRNKLIAGCEYRSMSNDPIYRADLLLDNAIFTSIVELTFDFEFE